MRPESDTKVDDLVKTVGDDDDNEDDDEDDDFN